MKLQPFHIHTINNGTLSAMAMPNARSLESDLQALGNTGIDKILCLLEEAESQQLGLQNQPSLTEKTGMEFQRFPIPDYGVPDFLDLQILITQIRRDLEDGKHLLVHCRGGVGRTGLICSCVLVTMGQNVPDAISIVTSKRGEQVPETPEQIDMIIRYAARNRNT